MVTATISPTTPEVSSACEVLDEAMAVYIRTAETLGAFLQYESTVESLNIFFLSIRHMEAVLALARHDLVLLPAACASARAALETATKAAWMVDDNDVFNRELRWLVHLQEEERVYERAAKRVKDAGANPATFVELQGKVQSFRLGVTTRLPAGYAPLKKNPSMDELLASMDLGDLYAQYIYLSQFVHGGHAATWLYRSGGLGTFKRRDERKAPSDWYLPLSVCARCLIGPGSRLLWRLGHLSKKYLSRSLEDRLQSSVTRVLSGPPEKKH